MSDYLAEEPCLSRLVVGKNIVELGAGGGVPSLACGVYGAARVVVTDYPDQALLDNLRHNVVENQRIRTTTTTTMTTTARPLEALPDLTSVVAVEGHVWGKSPNPVLGHLPDPGHDKFNLILLSDLIFNHSQHLALMRSCESLIDAREGQGTALVFHSHHLPHWRDRDLGFFTLAKQRGWQVKPVVDKVMGVQFVDDQGDQSVRERVWGWEMTWDGIVREVDSDEE